MILNSQVRTQDVACHYDELDEIYRDLWGTDLHHGLWINGNESKRDAVQNLSRTVLSYLGDLGGMHLMDIGCGYGETSRLASVLGAESVTGITLSPKQYQYARVNSGKHQVEFILGDWLLNNVPEHTFDGAYSIECFSHILDKKKYFDEVRRTLKPGRRFVMAAWLSSEKPNALDKSLILEPICKEGRLPSLCSKSEVMNLITDSGLKFIEHVDLSEKVWKTWLLSLKETVGLLTTKKGLKYLLNSDMKEKKFALSVLRILAGYKKGCFKYGIFVMKS